MMTAFHFLRPWWLLAIIPLIGLGLLFWRQSVSASAWNEICDSHLLEHLVQKKGQRKGRGSVLFLFLSVFLMIFSLAGPTWHQLPAPTYRAIQPRVLVLDMSPHMLVTDLSPNRLDRAKFKLHDILMHQGVGQFGLVVFTGEPFVVSPLTEDGQTIASLLPMLTPDIMPLGGHKLEAALKEASQLIEQAGFNQGQILVLTADAPSLQAITTAKNLALKGMDSSIMPIMAAKDVNPLFQRFAQEGQGQLLDYFGDSSNVNQWLEARGKKAYSLNADENVPLWRDEGPWFLFCALVFFLPVFRQGWLQRVGV